jgi:hypothetical protein
MTFSYDPFQVVLSVLIAIAASYASLDLAGRVAANPRRIRALWLTGGAISMGSGIWAMHFVGMLAFHLLSNREIVPDVVAQARRTYCELIRRRRPLIVTDEEYSAFESALKSIRESLRMFGETL